MKEEIVQVSPTKEDIVQVSPTKEDFVQVSLCGLAVRRTRKADVEGSIPQLRFSTRGGLWTVSCDFAPHK